MHSGAPLPPEANSIPTRELDRSLIRGIAWTGVAKWVTQIISWVTTPIVARLLSPADYGVASMAVVYVGLLQINHLGLAAAIVQRRDLSQEQVAKLGGFSVILGAAFFLLSIPLASPIAHFFGNAEVGPAIAVLSTIFLTSSFQMVPRGLLTRNLEFRRLASLDAVEALVGIVMTLVLALLGFRYWALILGAIASRLTGTVLALVWRHHPLRWPAQFKTIAGPIAFGFHVVIGGIAWYVFRTADHAIVGERLGSAALGSYGIAVTLASIPVDRLSALVAQATPAIFATVQHDRPALRRYVLALTEGIALVTFPATVGLALVATEFVEVVLGESWRASITPLRVLALVAAYTSLMPLLTHVLLATGQSKRTMQANIVLSIVLVPLFYVGSKRGIDGVAFAWLIAYPIVSFAFFVRHAFSACGMTVRLYLRSLWPATSATLLMATVVLTIAVLAPNNWPSPLLLTAKCVAGAAGYIAFVWYRHNLRLRSFFAVLRGRGGPDLPLNALERQAPDL